MSSLALRHAESDAEITACFLLVRQLRPHLVNSAEMLARVRRQQEDGYRLLVAMDGDRAAGAAGYRFQENLVRGPFVYVDDLVVDQSMRGRGVGARLLDEVAAISRTAGRDWIVLDTALGNALGQRFYFRWGLLSTGLHFSRRLG